MAKPKSHKQPNKAAKAKKAAKQPAEAPEVQASAPSELQSQADTPVASEPLPEAVVPPAAEATAAAPTAAESAPLPTCSVDAEAAPAPPAQAKTKKPPKEPKAKKASALDAAAKVLAESGEAMTTQAMIEAMAAKGYWSSPGGQTPSATLYSAIIRELSTKGEQARFVKTQRGKFGLRSPQ